MEAIPVRSQNRDAPLVPQIGDVITTTFVTHIKDLNDVIASGVIEQAVANAIKKSQEKSKSRKIDEHAVGPTNFDPAKIADELGLWALAGRDRFFQEVRVENEKTQWVEVGVETLRLILREHFVSHKVSDN